ncbi:hypothetical protein PIB30_042922 [Stylosanthes scabra]|uniref:GRF-type domain-containing protein n=1 Tax=Stylosanthes scabra TaxID=79078 RepID=A0ABU6WDG2_9FABA|nr:hypothetical protein [Stylosanthes scabra]
MGGEASSSFESKMKPPSMVSCASNSSASSYGWVSRRTLKKHPYNGGRCYHGINAVLLKSCTVENPNRWFLRCPHYKLSELRCEYFVWVDEVHEHDMERVSEEKKMSQHKISDGDLKEDSNYVFLFNTISRMKCEISALKKLVTGLFVGLGIFSVINLYNLSKALELFVFMCEFQKF